VLATIKSDDVFTATGRLSETVVQQIADEAGDYFGIAR
jgi:hypothetical protein